MFNKASKTKSQRIVKSRKFIGQNAWEYLTQYSSNQVEMLLNWSQFPSLLSILNSIRNIIKKSFIDFKSFVSTWSLSPSSQLGTLFAVLSSNCSLKLKINEGFGKCLIHLCKRLNIAIKGVSKFIDYSQYCQIGKSQHCKRI